MLTMLLTALSLASCNRQEKKQIAVIPKGTAHIFWQTVQAGALAAGDEFKVQVLWNGPANETDYSRQLQILDSMIARRVSAIAIAAQDRNALNSALDRAMKEDIPVTVFDSGVESDHYMTFVATNNYEGGKLAARTLGGLLHGRGQIAEMQNAPGSSSTMDRERGFEEVMAGEFPGVNIVAKQYTMSDRAKAMGITENFLNGHPELDGIFASAEPASVGASQGLKARGLGGKVKLVAFDSSDGLIADLRSGVISALVVQDPFQIGFQAVKTLADKLNGKTPPKQIDLAARLITKEDLEKPEIHALLYPDLKKWLK